MIYLDNNATTELDPAVLDKIQSVAGLGPLNASSQHAAGRLARRLLDEACSTIARLLGADIDTPGGDQLVITSGGTESNHLALHGLGEPQAALVVSAIEHPSVLSAAAHAKQHGRSVQLLVVDPNGRVDLNQAAALLARMPPGTVVSVMAANNETGVLQPWREIGELCRSHGLVSHVDATQWVGKLPLDFAASQIDALTFTAHKFHGPAGVGGLLLRRGTKLRPAMLGGEQQLGLRPGTEPVALVVGMALALELAQQQFGAWQTIQLWRDQFEQQLRAESSDFVVFGQTVPRLPGTACFAWDNVDRQAMLLSLDLAGLACSSGSACASGSSRPSHVLQAMGVSDSLVNSALRIGLSRFSTESEVQRAGELIISRIRKLRA